MRVKIKRLLKKYEYPPAKQPQTVKTVMEKAELMCGNNMIDYEEYKDQEKLKVSEKKEEKDK